MQLRLLMSVLTALSTIDPDVELEMSIEGDEDDEYPMTCSSLLGVEISRNGTIILRGDRKVK